MKATSVGFAQAADQSVVGAVFYVEATFSTGVLRACTWGAERTWNGQVWQGLGEVLEVSPPKESEDSAPQRFEISLSGLRQDLISLALGSPDVYRNKPIRVFMQIINASGAEFDFGSGPVTAELYCAGYMDSLSIENSASSVNIRLQCITSLFGAEPNPAVDLFNNTTHQAQYPGERALERQASLAATPTTWLTARFLKPIESGPRPFQVGPG